MMYRELITALRKQAIDLPEKFSKNAENIDLFMKAADAIEELATVVLTDTELLKHYGGETGIKSLQEYASKYWDLLKNAPRWIPVTETLPKKDVPVLVYLFGDSPYIAWINHEGEWETEEFIIDSDYLPKVWMPLPEPPKEEHTDV